MLAALRKLFFPKSTAARKRLKARRAQYRQPLSLRMEQLEGRALLASLVSDALDYAPGTTVMLTASGYEVGEPVSFQVSSSTAGPGQDPWIVSDGIIDGGDGDLDGAADGNVTTSWLCDPEGAYAGAMLTATATGLSSGEAATATFTDSAIFTSNSDGTVINQNSYPTKADVYFTGGPGPSAQDAGTYYYQVTDSSGSVLLSTDSQGDRKFSVDAGHEVDAYLGTGHVIGTNIGNGGLTFGLAPFNDSANGVYKLSVISVDDYDANVAYNADHPDHPRDLYQGAKSDNFHVADDGVNNRPDSTPAILVVKSVAPASINEGGVGNQTVTYTYTITNTSPADTDDDPVTITSIVDDKLGNLTNVAIAANGGNPIVIAEGGSFSFTTTVTLGSANAGASITNVVTVGGHDDEGTAVNPETDDAKVIYTDVLPSINVVKSANPATVPEGPSSHPITYTYLVTNTSAAGAFDLLSGVTVTDSDGTPTYVSGDVDNDGILEVGETWTFTLTVSLAGANAGTTHTNTVTASGADDEGNPATDNDNATVTYTDVLPAISIIKTPNVGIIAVGGTVTFTYLVTNTSPAGVFDPLSNVTLSDTDGTPTLVLKTGGDQDNLLETGETWKYTLVKTNVQPNAGPNLDIHTNTVTATGKDDENNTATGTDTANVVTLEECGGRTIGYWKNNGNSSVTQNDFAAMTAMNLRNEDGTNRDFTSTSVATNRSNLAAWLSNSTATNMAYKLSAQLASLKLSVLHNISHVTDYVYVPALNNWGVNPQGSALMGNLNNGPSGTLTNAGFINIGTLMAKADKALCNDAVDGLVNGKVVVNSANAQRKYYEALKATIEAINYSYAGSGSDPGPICISAATYDVLFDTDGAGSDTGIWHDDDHDGVIDAGELG